MRLEGTIIDRLERETGESMDYARDIAEHDPAGLRKFFLMGPLTRHRGSAPAGLVALARLGAVVAEDCGPCVSTGVRMARRAGVPAETLRAALAGGEALGDAERDAYRFGWGVAAGEVPDELRARVEARLGRAGLVALTLAAASVRIFPAVKRGLGYARSRAETPVEV